MIASALLGQLVPPQLELEKALRTPKANQERQLAIYHEFRNRQWPASGEQACGNALLAAAKSGLGCRPLLVVPKSGLVVAPGERSHRGEGPEWEGDPESAWPGVPHHWTTTALR